MEKPMLNTMDAPSHSSLRALLRKQFMPRRVKELGARIQGVVDGLLDEMRDVAQPDFVAHFSSRACARSLVGQLSG